MTSPRIEDFPPLRRRRRLRDLKSVPVLPSLVTLGNVFFGFLAIAKVADALRTSSPGAPFSAVVTLFEWAAILIFVAMVFDALDGRVARMTGQTTPFGTVPRYVNYTVSAVFEIGVYDFDKAYVIMPMEDAQTLLLLGDTVGMIEV